MKTADYVRQFKLDVEGFEFNREEFVKALGKEFKERLEATITACRKLPTEFTFEKFLHCIKEQEDKFWAISNKKVGEPLTQGLFSAFFATQVIPIRKKLFPEIHAQIEKNRLEAKARREEEERIRKEEEEKTPTIGELIAAALLFEATRQNKEE